ncbi:MAG TPA: hypothetical protein VGO93_15365 [Candidatus Xenobia bacterium]|jgi:hypothetical protein
MLALLIPNGLALVGQVQGDVQRFGAVAHLDVALVKLGEKLDGRRRTAARAKVVGIFNLGVTLIANDDPRFHASRVRRREWLSYEVAGICG